MSTKEKVDKREAKILEKQRQQIKRQFERELNKQSKPGECQKFITVIFESSFLKNTFAPLTLENLNKLEMKYDVDRQPINGLITFTRRNLKLKGGDDNDDDIIKRQRLYTDFEESLEDNALFLMPLDIFLEKVKEKTLCQYLDMVTLKTSNRHRLTVFVKGLSDYFKSIKRQENVKFKKRCISSTTTSEERLEKTSSSTWIVVVVSKEDIDEELMDVQMKKKIIFNFFEKDNEIATAISQSAKAIAEAPFKKEEYKKNAANCLSFFSGKKSRTFRIANDGSGVSIVWLNQLQQLKNLSQDIAAAIVAEYPTPYSLFKQYEKLSVNDGENLLQDIPVRRGAGLIATSRKIGKELSKRVYLCMTCENANTLLS